MSNTNAVTAYKSTSGLTTGSLITFFPQTMTPAPCCLVEGIFNLAAETTAPTATLLTVGSQDSGLTMVITGARVVCIQSLTFVAGTTPTITAKLQVNSNDIQASATALVVTGTTALSAGQSLAMTLAPQSSNANTLRASGDTLGLVFAFTGSPTSCSGSIKVLVDAEVVPV